MIKLSANLGFLWTELPLLERIAAASRAGFEAVELHFPYDHKPEDVKRACADHGVKLLGINTSMGPNPADRGLGAVPGRETEALALIDQAFDFAAAAGGTSVHVMAGVVTPEQRAAARPVFIKALHHAVRRAEQTGLTGLLEPINQRNMPGYFHSLIEDTMSIIDEVGSPRLKIMFDCYHLGISQGDVITRMRKYLPDVGHVQVAAVPSRAEPDEGELAYGNILAELDRLGWDGWVGCEYQPRAGTDAGLAWIPKLRLRLRA